VKLKFDKYSPLKDGSISVMLSAHKSDLMDLTRMLMGNGDVELKQAEEATDAPLDPLEELAHDMNARIFGDMMHTVKTAYLLGREDERVCHASESVATQIDPVPHVSDLICARCGESVLKCQGLCEGKEW
jgi:hypothetical protein